VTQGESKSSPEQELHAASAHIAVGLVGPREELEEFIRQWCFEASNAATVLRDALFPNIQLVPMQEVESPEDDGKFDGPLS
jgi:hypothetical protein